MLIEGSSLRAACDRCHKRKQRCMRSASSDDNTPCRRCREAGESCVFSPPCRLGRPSNKSKQQPQQQDVDTAAVDVSSSDGISGALTSHIRMLKGNGLEKAKKRNRSHSTKSGPRPDDRRPGRSGRPRQVHNSPRIRSVTSPLSTVSSIEASEDIIPSVATVTKTIPSSEPYTQHLQQQTTMSLQQTHSTQLHHPHQPISYPNSMSFGYYRSAPIGHPADMQLTEIDSDNHMWHMHYENPYQLPNGYTVGNMLRHHHHIPTSDTPIGHSDLRRQLPHVTTSTQQIEQTTSGSHSHESCRNSPLQMQHNQHFDKSGFPKPSTPPPLLPTSHVDCVEDTANGFIHSGFIHAPVDTYFADHNWSSETSEPYHAVYDKSNENPIITTATLLQNYQLQLQLTSATNFSIMGANGGYSRDSMHHAR